MSKFAVGERVEVAGRVLAIRPHVGVVTELHDQWGGPWHRFVMVKLDNGPTIGVAIHKLKPQDWREHL